MKARTWLRGLAGVLALFALGHTLGTAVPKVTRGPSEAAVFRTMQSFRFPVMGFERTYWDFYRGFALIISVLLVLMAMIAWQLSTVSEHDPRRALPMAVTLQLGCAGLLVLSRLFFFGGPIIMSLAATLCATVVVMMLARATLAHRAVPIGRE